MLVAQSRDAVPSCAYDAEEKYSKKFCFVIGETEGGWSFLTPFVKNYLPSINVWGAIRAISLGGGWVGWVGRGVKSAAKQKH